MLPFGGRRAQETRGLGREMEAYAVQSIGTGLMRGPISSLRVVPASAQAP